MLARMNSTEKSNFQSMETPYSNFGEGAMDDSNDVCVLPLSKSSDLLYGSEKSSMYDTETIDNTVHDGDHSYVSGNIHRRRGVGSEETIGSGRDQNDERATHKLLSN